MTHEYLMRENFSDLRKEVFDRLKKIWNQEDLIKETTSLPVSGKTVIVDAGHGTPDEGAESSSRNDRSGD